MNNSCYNCKNRHTLCHSHCETYKAYLKELDVIKRNKSDEMSEYSRVKRKYNRRKVNNTYGYK